ncbi:alkaline phosphatase family protein [soil metagenome]
MARSRIARLLPAVLIPLLATAAMAQPVRPIGPATKMLPGPIAGGSDLPNGWRITPAGAVVADLNDLILKLLPSPDGRVIAAVHSGYLAHGVSLIDVKTRKVVQEVPLKTTWLGLAWSPDGRSLYVSGGNANGEKKIAASVAPIYALAYANGRLDPEPKATLIDPTLEKDQVWWAGLETDAKRGLLYAANRGGSPEPTDVVAFDLKTGAVKRRIRVGANPYEVRLSADGRRLFASNWAAATVSVIDPDKGVVVKTLSVGPNPNDLLTTADGRLFVTCAGDNSVRVFDTRTLEPIETISTALYAGSPEGSTPNALAYDPTRKLLFAANADNNDVAVIDVRDRAHSAVAGFIPTGWYPSAVAVGVGSGALYVGATKGEGGHADLRGPGSPLAIKKGGDESIKTLQRSSVERVALPAIKAQLKAKLAGWTAQATSNSPYRSERMKTALAPAAPSSIPAKVGAGSPIKHVIYIIKENRTYDQILGDLPGANGDPRLAIFGASVTPNIHALSAQFTTFDNCYADGDVSQDGHSWSNGAYATDQNEKSWPANYGGHSRGAVLSQAYIPAAGYLWDQAKRAGLTYRSYGEYAARVSDGTSSRMEALGAVSGLKGHVSTAYKNWDARDTENAKTFIAEFDRYEAAFDSPDPNQRLPNYIVMGLPEDHTKGTQPGKNTPVAMVASNDQGVGMIVERVSHSRYWPQTAIFVIEDDAQDGPDHVDARRTVCLAISPYVKRGHVDSTLYSTSSMLRTMELLLGLPPLSQYDAAATPMYAAFAPTPDLSPYVLKPPLTDLAAVNPPTAYGARESARMNFADVDDAPMHRLNEIIWKSLHGAASPMPPPVHRYRALVDVSQNP